MVIAKPAGITMEADKKLFWFLVIGGVLLLLAGPKIKGLSGIEQRGRTKRKRRGRAEKYNLSGFISRIPMMFIVNRVVKSLRE